MTEHSKIVGGSNAGRVLACPPSIDRSALMIGGQTSTYAEEGTACHQAMEYILDDSDRTPADVENMVFNAHTMNADLMVNCIEPAYEAVTKILADHEYELEVTEEFLGIPGSLGTCDVGLTYEEEGVGMVLHAIDYKFGAGVPVDVAKGGKAQGMFYLHCLDPVMSPETEIDLFRFSIIQPRSHTSDEPRTEAETVDITPAEMATFVSDLKHAVKHRNNAKLAKGDHCRWCPAKPNCPEHVGDADKAHRLEVVAEKLPELLDLRDNVREWANSVDALVYAVMIDEAEPVFGWKVVRSQTHRKWTDELKIDKGLANRGLKVDERRVVKLKTPAAIEKLLKKIGKKMPADWAKAPVKLTTAREDDKRQAVIPGEGEKAVGNLIAKLKEASDE